MFQLLEKEKILNRTTHFCACEMKNSSINLKNKNLYNLRNMNSVILDHFHNQLRKKSKKSYNRQICGFVMCISQLWIIGLVFVDRNFVSIMKWASAIMISAFPVEVHDSYHLVFFCYCTFETMVNLSHEVFKAFHNRS